MKRNGSYMLTVQTRHGQFTFRNQKLWCPEHGSYAFLQASEATACAVTCGLQALAVQTCLNAGSYEKARQMLQEVTGAALLTRQTLCNWVAKTAKRLNRHLVTEAQAGGQHPLPPLTDAVDVYDPDAPEVIVFEDGILVKAQKPTHARAPLSQSKADAAPQSKADAAPQSKADAAPQSKADAAPQSKADAAPQSKADAAPQSKADAAPQSKADAAPQSKPCQFHQSYFALAPNAEGTYQFVMASSDGTLALPDALRAFVCGAWHKAQEPLTLLAITDGAKDLRNDLFAAFGTQVVTILDWFHLRKKVCELCSMLVSTKEARTALKKQMLKLLFQGKVADALEVLAHLPVRNAAMHQKLVSYLNNHAHEIIDYSRRAQAKKPIGSGRMEKGVDQVIGIRQKDKGMSWSKAGSYALGMLTACCANGHWEQLWNTSDMAA